MAVALLYVNLSAFLVGPNCVQSIRSSREKSKKKKPLRNNAKQPNGSSKNYASAGVEESLLWIDI